MLFQVFGSYLCTRVLNQLPMHDLTTSATHQRKWFVWSQVKSSRCFHMRP